MSRADQLLLTLMYCLEYRTEFHVSLTYGISESTVCRTIKKIENTLIQSERFHLPSRKVLQSGSMALEVTYHRQSRWLEILNRSKRLNNLSCLKAAAIQTG